MKKDKAGAVGGCGTTLGKLRFGAPEIVWGVWWVFAIVIGGSVYATHSFSLLTDDPLRSLLCAVAVFAMASCVAMLIQLAGILLQGRGCARELRPILAPQAQGMVLAGSTLFLAAACGICWLSYYPGTLSYDIAEQLRQVSGDMALSDWNPILHTGTLWVCVRLGELLGGGNKWLAIYSLASIAAFLLVVAYLEHWLMRRGHGVACCAAIVAFLGLCPLFPLMSFTPTRDVVFGYSFLMFSLALIDVVEGRVGKGALARLFIFGVIACQLRHNAPYGLLVSALLLLAVWKSRLAAGAVGTAALVSLLLSAVVIPAFGVAKTPAVESLSVPLSQMAKVLTSSESAAAHTDGTKSAAADDARAYFVSDIEYNPRFADPVKKNSFNDAAFDEDKMGFFSAYVRLGIEHPVDYLAAAIELDMDYWYPFAETPDPVSERVYFETATSADGEVAYPIGRRDLLPRVKAYYDAVASHEASFMSWPVVGFIFSLSFPCSVMLLSLYGAARFGGKRNGACLLLALLLPFFLTYLIGPVANLRYILPVYLMLPLLVCLFFDGLRGRCLVRAKAAALAKRPEEADALSGNQPRTSFGAPVCWAGERS